MSTPHEAGWQGEGAAGSCGDEPQRAGAARPANCHRGRFAELLPSVADAGVYSNKQDVR